MDSRFLDIRKKYCKANRSARKAPEKNPGRVSAVCRRQHDGWPVTNLTSKMLEILDLVAAAFQFVDKTIRGHAWKPVDLSPAGIFLRWERSFSFACVFPAT